MVDAKKRKSPRLTRLAMISAGFSLATQAAPANDAGAQTKAIVPGYSVEYVPSRPVALIAELVGRARVRPHHAATFRDLKEGESVYRGDTLFVHKGGHIILEEVSGGTRQLVYIPEQTTYSVSRSPAVSDLIVRTLLPDPQTVEERMENLRTSKAPRRILASPHGRFDVISLSPLNENWTPDVADLGTEDTAGAVDAIRNYARMTALAVLDLAWLEVKTPLGNLFVFEDHQGLFPEIDIHLASRTTGPVLLTVWKDLPETFPLLSRALPAGTDTLKWRPPEVGSFTLQILSLQDSARSRIIRVNASKPSSKSDLIPLQVRPGDAILVPFLGKAPFSLPGTEGSKARDAVGRDPERR